MATLVFDIETAGESWESLDTVTQGVLTEWINKHQGNQSEYAELMNGIKNNLGRSPLTGTIMTIGLYDVERAQGVVYFQGEKNTDEDYGSFILKSRTEQSMLEDFWEGAKGYDTFVTFNGRRFDVPFLNIRSAVHSIRPTHDLMEGRYLYQQKSARHIDLQDQMTFYGALQRRPALHVFCRAFGIESPLRECGGREDTTELFPEKKFRGSAVNTVHTVTATTKLYEKWLQYLAPQDFL